MSFQLHVITLFRIIGAGYMVCVVRGSIKKKILRMMLHKDVILMLLLMMMRLSLHNYPNFLIFSNQVP